eukprot:366524-Chlamydomonas_euryale.AAC.2
MLGYKCCTTHTPHSHGPATCRAKVREVCARVQELALRGKQQRQSASQRCGERTVKCLPFD